MQIPATRYILRWRWRVVLITLVLVTLFIRLGLWQWHKAEERSAMHDALKQHAHSAVTLHAKDVTSAQKVSQLHSHKVQVTGQYVPAYTFLLDNQVENGQPGFHVMTPFLIAGTKTAVWVNRGWLAGSHTHALIPKVQTSTQQQTITGLAWQIKKTAFQLGSPSTDWQPVQAVIDFARLRQHVPFAMPAMIIKLDATVSRDGYVRHWQLPAGEIEKNLGYAFQWFGFATAAILIALYQMIEQTGQPQNQLQGDVNA